MASKQPRFTRKVYECWALETRGGQPHATDGVPHLYATKVAVLGIAYADESAVPVRVTVERIAAKKRKKKGELIRALDDVSAGRVRSLDAIERDLGINDKKERG